MPQLKVRHFGLIKSGFEANDGWMSIHKVTVLIGNQTTGKSTVAKLIATFAWLEKMLYWGDLKESEVTRKKVFEDICGYYRLQHCFRPATRIEYRGAVYAFRYSNGRLTVESAQNVAYTPPQIVYVPAERNLLGVVSSFEKLKGLLPSSLYDFLEIYSQTYKDLPLSLGNRTFQYRQPGRTPYIAERDYRIPLSEASSGLQSAVPLLLASQSRKSHFIRIVEEPEQSLFPTSQRDLLFRLLELTNRSRANRLILTTHSPYIINYLTLALKGYTLLSKVRQSEHALELLKRLESIVPASSCTSPEDTVIYECREDGSITKLPEYDGLPSDENMLNTLLADSNLLFDALLEIEDAL